MLNDLFFYLRLDAPNSLILFTLLSFICIIWYFYAIRDKGFYVILITFLIAMFLELYSYHLRRNDFQAGFMQYLQYGYICFIIIFIYTIYSFCKNYVQIKIKRK